MMMSGFGSDISYTISFADNFSGTAGQFRGEVVSLTQAVRELDMVFESGLNRSLKAFKTLVGTNLGGFKTFRDGLASTNRHLANLRKNIIETNQAMGRMFTLVNAYERAISKGFRNANAASKVFSDSMTRQQTLYEANIRRMATQEKIFERQLAKAVEAKAALNAIPNVVGDLRQGMGGNVYISTGGSRKPSALSKFQGFEGAALSAALAPTTFTSSRANTYGKTMRNVGQGMFQSGMAGAFALYPIIGAGGRGMKYNQTIDDMVTGAKLRSSEVKGSKALQAELNTYLRNTFSTYAFDTKAGQETLERLGAYGMSFKSDKGTFKGSQAEKFFKLNMMAKQSLDMNPTELAKYQMFALDSAKRQGITDEGKQIEFVSERFKYLNYLADTYGVAEKDIVRSANTKVRAALQIGTNKYARNAEDDVLALAAFGQRYTGRTADKSASVISSMLARMGSGKFLVGSDKNPGLLNQEQAGQLRTVLRDGGTLKGLQALSTLLQVNRNAVFKDELAKGLVSFDANGNLVTAANLSEKQKLAISQKQLGFEARVKSTVGEYGKTIESLLSTSTLAELKKMIGVSESVLAPKGVESAFKAYQESWSGTKTRFDNATDALLGSLTKSLIPSLMVAMDGLAVAFTNVSNFLNSHPLLSTVLGGTALAGMGLSLAGLGTGALLNFGGMALQGYGGIKDYVKQKQVKKQQASAALGNMMYLQQMYGGGMPSLTGDPSKREVRGQKVQQRKLLNPRRKLGVGSLVDGIANIGLNMIQPSMGGNKFGAGLARGVTGGIQAGRGMLPAIGGGVMSVLTSITNGVSGLLVPALQGLGAAVGFLLTPVGLVTSAIALLGGGFVLYLSQFNSFKTTLSNIGDMLMLLGETFSLWIQGLGVSLSNMITGLDLSLREGALGKFYEQVNPLNKSKDSPITAALLDGTTKGKKGWAEYNKQFKVDLGVKNEAAQVGFNERRKQLATDPKLKKQFNDVAAEGKTKLKDLIGTQGQRGIIAAGENASLVLQALGKDAEGVKSVLNILKTSQEKAAQNFDKGGDSAKNLANALEQATKKINQVSNDLASIKPVAPTIDKTPNVAMQAGMTGMFGLAY